jgi:hypothetical protein
MADELEQLVSTAKKAIGKGLSLRLVKSKGAKAELAVIVGDAATAEDLRKAWPIIDKARTDVRRTQGSPMSRIDNALIFSYAQMRVLGKWSYAFIAQDINFDVLVNLVRAAEKSAEGRESDSEKSYLYAHLLLKAMRMKDFEIQSWLDAGLKDIEQGKAPWSVDKGPVTADRVREALRQLERDLESGKIVIKESPRTASVSMEVVAAKNDEVISRAESLLTRNFPKPLQRYKNYTQKKLRESLNSGSSKAGNSG